MDTEGSAVDWDLYQDVSLRWLLRGVNRLMNIKQDDNYNSMYWKQYVCDMEGQTDATRQRYISIYIVLSDYFNATISTD